jgi:hypothetical protein
LPWAPCWYQLACTPSDVDMLVMEKREGGMAEKEGEGEGGGRGGEGRGDECHPV